MLGRRGVFLALLAGLSLLAACDNKDDSLTGVWTGAFTDSLGGAGGGTLVFTQSGSDLSGTWEVVFSSTSRFNNSGTLAGTVEGSSISATLAGRRGCNYAMTASRTRDRIRGTYKANDCPAQTGSLDLEKRS